MFFLLSFILLFIIYLNELLIQLLDPIEYLNLDIQSNLLYNFFFFNNISSFYDIDNINNVVFFNVSNENLIFDYYPIFKININNNN